MYAITIKANVDPVNPAPVIHYSQGYRGSPGIWYIQVKLSAGIVAYWTGCSWTLDLMYAYNASEHQYIEPIYKELMSTWDS